MECLTERTIKIEQIHGVIKVLSKVTLETYLKHWRFNPFVRHIKGKTRWRCEYVYCKDFFNQLYTYLVFRDRIEAAENLKNTFALVGMNLKCLED